jgi:hypothetical protein
MKTREIEKIDLSSRTSVSRGDTVRLSRGPYRVTSRGDHVPLTLRGTFRVRSVLESTRGGSRFLHLVGLDKSAGEFTVLIDGPTRKRHGVHWRPYRVRKIK